jgi:hypothetical protein
VNGTDDALVDEFLCNLSPVILNTLSPPYHVRGHFLVATGRVDDNNWIVNDPGNYNLTELGSVCKL